MAKSKARILAELLGSDQVIDAEYLEGGSVDLSTESINALSDVDTSTTAPSSGETLTWNGTTWVPGNSVPDGVVVDGDFTTSGFMKTDGSGNYSVDASTYLTSFTETDPVFTASAAYNITTTQISNWDTAYSWGDHSSAGYVTSSPSETSLTNVVLQTLNNPNFYGDSLTDRFGASTAIGETYTVVGAPWEYESSSISQSGKVYVFNTDTGELVHTLGSPNAATGDYFGYSVAIDGNLAIVGAYQEDFEGESNSGRAYIFDLTTGSLLHTLDNPNAYNTRLGDLFGSSVSISGNYAIVGAYGEDDADGNQSGKAYIFDVTTGSLLHTLDNPNPVESSAYDNFGNSVDIKGSLAIVAANQESVDKGSGMRGYNGIYSSDTLIAATPYIRTEATGYEFITTSASEGSVSEIAYITPGNTNMAEIVGLDTGSDDDYWDVAPPWSTTYLGASFTSVYYGSNGYLTFGAGSYEYSDFLGGIPIPKILLFANDNKCNGLWAQTTGTAPNRVHRVVIKLWWDAYNNYNDSDPSLWQELRFYESNPAKIDFYTSRVPSGTIIEYNAGIAYIFNAETGALLHTLQNPSQGSTEGDRFGNSVAISDTYAVVGASRDESNSGAAYIFNSVTGQLLHTVKSNTSSNVGYDVALNSTHAIISAFPQFVHIVDLETGVITQTINNPTGSIYDNYGYSLSCHNNKVIIGAYGDGSSLENKAYIVDIEIDSQKFKGEVNAELLSIKDSVLIDQNRNLLNIATINGSDTANWDAAYSWGNHEGKYLTLGEDYRFTPGSATLIATFDNPNKELTPAGDRFGNTVLVSEKYIVSSAAYENVLSAKWGGVVYVFDKASGSLLHQISNPNNYFSPYQEYFGSYMDLLGDTLVVGSPLEDNASGSQSGVAYVFDLTTGNLTLTIENPNAAGTVESDYFGQDVALAEGYIIVGAAREDGLGSSSGVVYVFNSVTGALVHTLLNPNIYGDAGGDNFGNRISADGNYVIISASSEDTATQLSTGAVYIFDIPSGTLIHSIPNPNENTTSSDMFGNSVKLKGDYAIVGAYSTSLNNYTYAGKAYIFNVLTGSLLYTLENPNPYGTPASDRFGSSVDINEDYALVGTYLEDPEGISDAGVVHVFSTKSGKLITTVNSSNLGTSYYFGYSVAVYNDTLIVGAYNDATDGSAGSGKTYQFTLSLPKYNILGLIGDQTNWDTAFSWGDHSTQGYLTSETDTLQTVTSRGNSTTNLIVAENGIRIGTGDHNTDGRASLTFGEGAPTSDSMYIEYDGENLSGDDNAIILGSSKDGVGDVFSVTYGGSVKVGSNSVFHDGYHPNADKWTTARTLSLTGDVTGSVSWDGSGNASLSTTVGDNSHNHTSLTGVTSIAFAAEATDAMSISRTVNGTGTYFDFNLTDDNNNDWWRWRFTPSGSTVYDAMTLKPVSNGNADLTVSGSVYADSFDATSQVRIGSEVILKESADRADLLEITSTTSGWGGLQIRNSSNEGRWSFMTDGVSAGIYDDENGDWHIQMTENSGVALSHNGLNKIATTSTGATVFGLLTATTKSFTIDHPTKEGYKLRYGSLEGPENGVYVRGRLKGDNTIELPEYWKELVHEDSITVELTAIGKKQELWVVDFDNETVTVDSDAEEINCFYIVYSERKDVDKLVTEFEE